MSNVNSNERCNESRQEVDSFAQNLTLDHDIIMEEILNNLNTTPLGKVLKRITNLPEVRKNKVLNLRRQIYQGRYDLNTRLDRTLEKVLADLEK